MNDLQIFRNNNFGEVRVTEVNGEPMFCLADVCKVVNLTNPSSVKKRLDAEDVQLLDLHALKRSEGSIIGNSMATFITESGFYDVLLFSDAPQVRPFKNWVTREVLPAIRKTGGYIATRAEDTPEEIMAKALAIAKDTLERREQRIRQLEADNSTKQATIESQTAELTKAAPKVRYYDETLQSVNTLTTTQVAKSLGMDAQKLNKKLKEHNIIYRQSGQWLLYTPYCNWGLHSTRTQTYTRTDGSTGASVYTVWTQRGRLFIAALMENEWKVKKAIDAINGRSKPIHPIALGTDFFGA